MLDPESKEVVTLVQPMQGQGKLPPLQPLRWQGSWPMEAGEARHPSPDTGAEVAQHLMLYCQNGKCPPPDWRPVRVVGVAVGQVGMPQEMGQCLVQRGCEAAFVGWGVDGVGPGTAAAGGT